MTRRAIIGVTWPTHRPDRHDMGQLCGGSMFGRYKKMGPKERAIRSSAESVVGEAQLILTGHLALSRPCWRYGTGPTFLNCLAHADWDTLRAVATEVRSGEGRAWDSALAFLAAELVSAAESPEDLLRIQRTELIPLELDVMRGAVPRPVTAARLVDAVRPRLSRAMAAKRGGDGPPPAC